MGQDLGGGPVRASLKTDVGSGIPRGFCPKLMSSKKDVNNGKSAAFSAELVSSY